MIKERYVNTLGTITMKDESKGGPTFINQQFSLHEKFTCGF